MKALSHDHNYHHPGHQETDPAPANDTWHDSAQHTEPAERQRFRRTEKIVDRWAVIGGQLRSRDYNARL